MYLTFHYLQSFLHFQSEIIDMTLLSSLLLLLNSDISSTEIAQLAIKNMLLPRARAKIWLLLSQLSWNPDSFFFICGKKERKRRKKKIIVAVCRCLGYQKGRTDNILSFWCIFSLTIKCDTVIWSDILQVKNTLFSLWIVQDLCPMLTLHRKCAVTIQHQILPG